MQIFRQLCISLSIGIIFGILGGAFKYSRHRSVSQKQIDAYQKLWKLGSVILTFVTLSVLLIGLLWCIYFLVLGIVSPSEADYANNMSELIVSVLSVISIFFAFYEFIRKKN